MHNWITLLLISLALPQGEPSTTPRQLSETLAAVSLNVKESRDVLPDFLCDEKVTSTQFKDGKKQDQKIVESIFSIQQSREHRQILAVDGKPAKKGAKMPGLPVNIAGSFNYMILATFSPQSLQWYEFAPGQKAEALRRMVVQFETKKDQKEMVWNINGTALAAHDTGQAWIDTASMQVVRLERNLLNLKGNPSKWKITIDQAPFVIGEKEFWLPKTFLTEITERDPRRTGTFVAEYTNCKKFTAEVTFRVQDK
jgi:hypothetical protein